MTADLRLDPSRFGAPIDHLQGIPAIQGMLGETAVFGQRSAK
jgi:hypothetical protein